MEIEDKAQRLHRLIERIVEVSQGNFVKHNGSNAVLANQPLWVSFEPIAVHLGNKDYNNFRNQFLALCASITADIATMPMKKESVRAAWLSRIDNVSKVFDAKNFGRATHDVFRAHFEAANLEALDSISERFQSVGLRESSIEEMESALAAVREALASLRSTGELDARVSAVLGHYLQQMEAVLAQVHDFGDELFWKTYKETFATFAQIHPIIAGLENADEIRSKLAVVWERLLSKSIAGISIGGNLASVGAFTLQALGPG